MKLLLLSPSPTRGGAEDYALTVARGAIRAGWSVTAALPQADGTRGLVDDFERAGAATAALPCVDSWGDGRPAGRGDVVRATRATARLIRSVRPDVVHVTLPWPPFGAFCVLAPALAGVPSAVVFQLVPQELEIGPARRVAYAAARRRRQTWVAVSENSRRTLARGFRCPVETLQVIPNGAPRPAEGELDAERPAARESVRDELGLEADTQLVLSVGRLHPQKGHAELLEAAAPLMNGDAQLVIAGDGPERERLERMAADHGGVRLLGARDDVTRLLLAADVFALPSRFEGFPFALVEAMAHGLPVVSSRFPGVEEALRDGRDGVVVDAGDAGELREAIRRLLDDGELAARLSGSAYERAGELTQDKMVERTLRLLSGTGRGGSR
ncbi:MAG: glycosyltransferase family 4 protein [Thermoleophilaceae bacterium]